MVYRIIFFLVLNFGALVIGSYFTEAGVSSEWYSNLDKAPWTPPGWMFGVAWSAIMICFAIYMAYGTKQINSRGLLSTFAVQWVLNVLWNPVFFYYHNAAVGLIIISALTILVAYMFYHYWSRLKTKSLWLAPYVLWMLIATSLNAYIFIKN
jgi:tryptophan-rich sensory protein